MSKFNITRLDNPSSEIIDTFLFFQEVTEDEILISWADDLVAISILAKYPNKQADIVLTPEQAKRISNLLDRTISE